MKEKKQVEILAWFVVVASIVFAVWLTPKALDWWERLVNADQKTTVVLAWEYPKNEPDPDRMQIYRDSELYQVLPGSARESKIMIYKYKTTAFHVCAFNIDPEEQACSETILIHDTQATKSF